MFCDSSSLYDSNGRTFLPLQGPDDHHLTATRGAVYLATANIGVLRPACVRGIGLVPLPNDPSLRTGIVGRCGEDGGQVGRSRPQGPIEKTSPLPDFGGPQTDKCREDTDTLIKDEDDSRSVSR